MNVTILEWKASEWRYIRELLDLTTGDVYDETGIDPYDAENHIRMAGTDKARLANYYNRLLREAGYDVRMSMRPPRRRNNNGK
jgi:hypothetical protein